MSSYEIKEQFLELPFDKQSPDTKEWVEAFNSAADYVIACGKYEKWNNLIDELGLDEEVAEDLIEKISEKGITKIRLIGKVVLDDVPTDAFQAVFLDEDCADVVLEREEFFRMVDLKKGGVLTYCDFRVDECVHECTMDDVARLYEYEEWENKSKEIEDRLKEDLITYNGIIAENNEILYRVYRYDYSGASFSCCDGCNIGIAEDDLPLIILTVLVKEKERIGGYLSDLREEEELRKAEEQNRLNGEFEEFAKELISDKIFASIQRQESRYAYVKEKVSQRSLDMKNRFGITVSSSGVARMSYRGKILVDSLWVEAQENISTI